MSVPVPPPAGQSAKSVVQPPPAPRQFAWRLLYLDEREAVPCWQ